MVVDRWLMLLAACGTLTAVPACLPMAHQGPPPTPIAVEPVGGSEFARLRSPGERVALHEPTVAVTQEPPKVIATVSEPPAVAGTTFPPPPAPITIVPPVIGPNIPTADPALVAAVRAHLENHPEVALEHLKAFDPATQDLLLRLIPAIVRASQSNIEKISPHELALLVGELEAAAAGLSGKVPLMVEKACFCRGVRTFGRYDPVPEGPFAPGARVILYAEVRNVPSEPITLPVDGNGFLTKLMCTLQLHDTSGAVINLPDKNRNPVPMLRDAKRDFSRSPLRDYFLVFEFPAPTKAGSYTVTFEVRDPATGRAVSRTMPFRVQ